MSRTYKTTGINLKSMPLGETDRLLTILTPELGLIQAVAPGCRKHHSKLGGRSELFVVNELLVAKGRSLDKITQAETIESYPGLSRDLLKLTVSQYLAELVLSHALSDQSQEELFCLLNEHLRRLEQLPRTTAERSFVVLAHLAHAVFHTLALAGIAPQVHLCCLTQQPLVPDFTAANWRVGFSAVAGGIVNLSALARLQAEGGQLPRKPLKRKGDRENGRLEREKFPHSAVSTVAHEAQETPTLIAQLSAGELSLLQELAKPNLPQMPEAKLELFSTDSQWLSVERILRHYSQYHFGKLIRSAVLIDTYFTSLSTSL